MCADIVIIGGGPIGCYTALQAKNHNPAADIRIYERYPEYQRDHMVSITPDTMKTCFSGDGVQGQIRAAIEAANENTQATRKGKSPIHIPLQVLEGILKQHCTAQGIHFTYAKIETPQDAMARHPECQLFVAADGAKSAMRAALLGPQDTQEQDLLYSVDVKYDVEGQAAYTRAPTYDKIDMIVVETIGREHEGKSQVALRFLLDKATYDSIPEATFKEPLRMSGRTIIPAHDTPDGRPAFGYLPNRIGPFEDDIRKFQNIRTLHTQEHRVAGSERVTKVKLSQYASQKFAVMAKADEIRQAGWFFAGDAAMGMPFYRSINAGLRLAARLGPVLADPKTGAAAKTAIYEAARKKTIRHEFAAVSRRLRGINLYRNYYRPAIRAAKWGGIGVLGVVTLPLTLPLLGLGFLAVRFGVIRLM